MEKMDKEQKKRSWIVFKEYYLKYIIAAVVCVAFIVGITVIDSMGPDEAMMAILVDVYATEEVEEYMDGFLEYAGLDPEENAVTLRSFQLDEVNRDSINSVQSIVAYLTAGQLDFGIMDRSSFAAYGYMGMYADLRNFLTAEQLASFEGNLFYIEAEDLEAREGLQGDEIHPELCGNPDGMKEPVPVGINLSVIDSVSNMFINVENECFAGVVENSERPEMGAKFLEYLLLEE